MTAPNASRPARVPAAPLPHLQRARARALALQDAGEPLVLVDSPPGAGKSTLVAGLAAELGAAGERVLIVTCTNAVSADLAARVDRLRAGVRITYVLGQDAALPPAAAALAASGRAKVVRSYKHLPKGPGVVIGNAAKWATAPDTPDPVFDVAFYDECYQLGWARMWPLMSLSERHVPVGDPGQCTPFTKAPADRWLGSPTGPLSPAAAVLARLLPHAPVLRLDRSMRLPQDTVDLVQPALYPSLPFTGHAPRGRRLLVPPAARAAGRGDALRRALAPLADGSIAAWDLPAAAPAPLDRGLCAAAASAAGALAGGTWRIRDENGQHRVGPADVAVVCARNDQVDHVRAALPARARGVTVGTANTLQGLEWPVVVAVCPLAGRDRLTAFDLAAGRLSVMTTRHRVAALLVGRAGTDERLALHVPASARALGSDDDEETDGWQAHQSLRLALRARALTTSG